MKNVVVKLENINKKFGKKKIVKDFNLEVYEGEFLTLLGSSGCGKTTILRMISGLEKVDSGKVYLDNEDVTNKLASERKVNTIFQNFALFNHMTVYDNISYGLKIKKVSPEEIKKTVNKMLDLVKLKGYENRYPNELSGGEKQRVAIARGLANNPKVLLLDEPLSSLDLKLKKEMQIELKRLQKKLGITFIYVTHNQEEALTMSNRILILNNGVIQQLDTPFNIYNNPSCKYVADFIGDSNIFSGKVEEIKGEFAYVRIFDDKIKIFNKDYQVNESIYIMIRPENFYLEKENHDNKLKFTVKDNIYNGSLNRIIGTYNTEEIKINVYDNEEISSDELTIYFNSKDISSFRR